MSFLAAEAEEDVPEAEDLLAFWKETPAPVMEPATWIGLGAIVLFGVCLYLALSKSP